MDLVVFINFGMLVPFRELNEEDKEFARYTYYKFNGDVLGDLVKSINDNEIKKYQFSNGLHSANELLMGQDTFFHKKDLDENIDILHEKITEKKLGSCIRIQINPEDPKSFVYTFEKSDKEFRMDEILS